MEKVVRVQLEKIYEMLANLLVQADCRDQSAAAERKKFTLVKKSLHQASMPDAAIGARRLEFRRAAFDDKENAMNKQYKGVKIRRRNDGRWYARIKLKKRMYHDVYGRTYAECYEKLKLIIDKPRTLKALSKSKEEKQASASLQVRYTVGQWYDYWLNTYKKPQCKSSTMRFIENVYQHHVAKIESVYLDELTSVRIQELLAAIASECMRRKAYVMLKDMIHKAVVSETIAKDPFGAVIAPKYKPQEQLALEPEEQQAFWAIAKDAEFSVVYALMLFQGLRTGEAKALRHCDIKQDYIVVRTALDDRNEIGSTKTRTIRKVPIFAPFRELADRLRSTSTAMLLPRANKHTANDEYREIMQRLGMEYNMYALRHTFATNCARAGIVSKQVALWMGHADITTTLKYYTNISTSFESSNVRRLDTNFDINSDTEC